MINIYSIKEVVEASNNILKRSKDEKKVIQKNKIEDSTKIFLKKEKPLILIDAIPAEKEIKFNSDESNTKIMPNKNKVDKKNQIVDQLYIKFNKKIKKNTLKLIFELQKEKSIVNKTKNNLQLSNIDLKKKISILNNEIKKINELNAKIIKDKDIQTERTKIIHKQLKDSQLEIETLKKSKSELDIEIINYKQQNEINSKKIYDISEVETKNKFYQEENIRIGSELLEVKKKHDIMKKEIEKYENQKSNLISKINSVNEALTETNILTNVFENKVEKKVNVIDHKKIETKSTKSLDDKIKNIFLSKE